MLVRTSYPKDAKNGLAKISKDKFQPNKQGQEQEKAKLVLSVLAGPGGVHSPLPWAYPDLSKPAVKPKSRVASSSDEWH